MKLNQYNIKSALKRIENGVVTYPVFLEVQTTSKKIEQHCFKEFNDLLWYTELNMTQLYALQKMKAYIKFSLSTSDKQDILKIFHMKGWFNAAHDLYSFKILECRCKMSSDRLPFLLIDAEISFNIKNTINHYIQNNKIYIKSTQNNITKETAEIYFKEPLPYILVYERSYDIQKEILKIISDSLSTSSPLSRQLDKAIGIEKTQNLRKEITWAEDRKIKIVINDFSGMLKAKVKKNWVPLTFAAIVAYDQTQKRKKQKLIANQLNIINKMQQMINISKEDEII